MFTKYLMKLLVLSAILNIQTSSQVLVGLAPLQPGNYWKYIDNDQLTVSFLVLDSTVEINGTEFFVIKLTGHYGSVHYRYWTLSPDSFYVAYDESAGDSLFKYLKYDCQLGDFWTQSYRWYNITHTVLDTASIPLFTPELIKVKHIYLNDNNLTHIHYIWNDYYGLLREVHEAEAYFFLAGCVINGTVYGDTTMPLTSILEEGNNLNQFNLEQNYPNPFNPVTTIPFSIPIGSNVKLVIHNVLGEVIEVLFDGYKHAGEHRVTFNGHNLPSGVYIYTLVTGNQIFSKHMLLLK